MGDIVVYNNKIKFDIELTGKFNVIIGESGSGKSTLIKLLDDALINHTAKLQCKYTIVPSNEYASNKHFETSLREHSGCIFYFDENHVLFDRGNISYFASALKESDNIFMLVCRDVIDTFPVSVNTLKVISYDKATRVSELTPYFDVSPIDGRLIVDGIVTEDSKSGNKILKRYVGEPCIPVHTDDGHEGGKDKLPLYIRSHNTPGCSLLVYDALSAILTEKRIIDAIKRSGHTWYRFHPESFEEYLLRSPFVQNIREFKRPDLSVNNQEEWYEKELDSVLPLGYNKPRTSPCILEECNEVSSIACKHCPNRGNSNKRSLLLHGGLENVTIK